MSGSRKRSTEVVTNDSEQSNRFIDAARELECDETGEAFDRALRHWLPPRKPGEPAPRIVEAMKLKGSRRRTTRPE